MTLSNAAREWFTKNGLEGFLRKADAPPHEEPEQVASTIDLTEIIEGTIQALTGLQEGGLQSLERPSTKILMEYFGEYSLNSNVTHTKGRTGVVGKHRSQNHRNQKFGLRIKVRSIMRINESLFLPKYITTEY